MFIPRTRMKPITTETWIIDDKKCLRLQDILFLLPFLPPNPRHRHPFIIIMSPPQSWWTVISQQEVLLEVPLEVLEVTIEFWRQVEITRLSFWHLLLVIKASSLAVHFQTTVTSGSDWMSEAPTSLQLEVLSVGIPSHFSIVCVRKTHPLTLTGMRQEPISLTGTHSTSVLFLTTLDMASWLWTRICLRRVS